MGPVRLVVRDLNRALGFYRDILGLNAVPGEDATVALMAGPETLVLLAEDRQATPRSPRATGLYHFAILTPSRRELARAVRGLVEAGYPVQGASDHGVSEALYLSDPEGNGIEIYADRPSDAWPRTGDALDMVTAPLDARGLLDELKDNAGSWAGLPAGTRIGHVHLQVSNIPATEAFYTRALGLDLMQRYGPSASFFSAGGYHHHVGANTWASAGASLPPPGVTGLVNVTLVLPDAGSLAQLGNHLREAGVPVEVQGDSLFVRDPSGNGVALVHA
jgi:catechol 2,3-dioxygenase